MKPNILEGVVRLSGSDRIPDTSPVLVSAGATLDLDNNTELIFNLNGEGVVDTGGSSGRLTVIRTSTWGGNIIGLGGLTKSGNNFMIITTPQSYTGSTEISFGTFRFTDNGSLSNATDVTVDSDGIWDLNNISDTVDSISGEGSIQLGGATLTVDETAGTSTFSGDITEAGTLQQDGGGTLVLSGDNTFTFLDINSGTVQVSSLENLGAGNIELGGGTLRTTASFTNSRPIVLAVPSSRIHVNSGTTLTQTGAILSLPSTLSGLTKEGEGTLLLSNPGGYNGNTSILEGVLRLGSSERLPNTTEVFFGDGAILDLNNHPETIQVLKGNAGIVQTGGASGRIIVSSDVVFAGITFDWNGTITGMGGLTKTGNHTMEISAAQTYTGETFINDGILRFTGSGGFSDASDITVTTGATWDLNGISDTVHSISGLGGTIQLGGATLTIAEDDFDTMTRNFSGQILGTGELEVNGNGTLILSGNNTFTSLDINKGTVQVASQGNLGVGALFLGNTVPFEENATLQVILASFTNANPITLLDSGTSGPTIIVDSGLTLAQAGAIQGSTFNKSGEGTLLLQASNTYGATRLSQGTIRLGGF